MLFCLSVARQSHKFASGPLPNYWQVHNLLTTQFNPIHLRLQKNINHGPFLRDWSFKGSICSPKFEGLTAEQCDMAVKYALRSISMENRVQLVCAPPSKWRLLKKHCERREFLP